MVTQPNQNRAHMSVLCACVYICVCMCGCTHIYVCVCFGVRFFPCSQPLVKMTCDTIKTKTRAGCLILILPHHDNTHRSSKEVISSGWNRSLISRVISKTLDGTADLTCTKMSPPAWNPQSPQPARHIDTQEHSSKERNPSSSTQSRGGSSLPPPLSRRKERSQESKIRKKNRTSGRHGAMVTFPGTIQEILLAGRDGIPHLLTKSNRGQDLCVLVPFVLWNLHSPNNQTYRKTGGMHIIFKCS